MSVELITIIIAAAGLVVTIVGGLFAASAWILRHTAQQMDARFAQSDARFDKVDARLEKMDERFEKVDDRLVQADAKVCARFDRAEANVNARFAHADASINARFNTVDKQFKEMGTQMSGLRAELNDVKVAVARLEGPHQRLILPPY